MPLPPRSLAETPNEAVLQIVRNTRAITLGVLALGLFPGGAAEAADAFFDTAHFSGSGNCALCHNGLFDA